MFRRSKQICSPYTYKMLHTVSEHVAKTIWNSISMAGFLNCPYKLIYIFWNVNCQDSQNNKGELFSFFF